MRGLFRITPNMITSRGQLLLSTPAGLQWCDIAVGKGETPVQGAFVKAHYAGSLDSDAVTGTFDSSYDRGRPLGFAVGSGQVIKGAFCEAHARWSVVF